MVQVAWPAYKVLDRNHHPSAADMLGTFWTKIDRSQFPFLFRTSEISHSRTKKRRAWNVGRQFCHHAMDAQLQYLVNWTYSLPQPPKFPVHYCLTKWVQWSLSSKHLPNYDQGPEVVTIVSFLALGYFKGLKHTPLEQQNFQLILSPMQGKRVFRISNSPTYIFLPKSQPAKRV